MIFREDFFLSSILGARAGSRYSLPLITTSRDEGRAQTGARSLARHSQ